jgi:hypothetical protein
MFVTWLRSLATAWLSISPWYPNNAKTPSKVTVKNPFFFWPSQTCFRGV